VPASREQLDAALLDTFFQAKEAVEHLQRDEMPGDAGRGQFFVA
jgi:hypothetical protein